MKMNEKGLQIIKTFERLYLEKYLCPAGYPTIGYGHIIRTGEPRKITEMQANEYLKKDISFVERGVSSLVKVSTAEDQFSAMVSFAFNVGVYALSESTFLKLHNARQFTQASLEFDRWNKSTVKGRLKPLDGLIRRRNAEEALYTGDYKTLKTLLERQGATS